MKTITLEKNRAHMDKRSISFIIILFLTSILALSLHTFTNQERTPPDIPDNFSFETIDAQEQIRDVLRLVPTDEIEDDPNDPDRDGLTNEEEAFYNTQPYNPDTDYDGLLDGAEVHFYLTIPTNVDSDYDYIADSLEIFKYNTNPLLWDTDGDGLHDGFELWTYRSNAFHPDTDFDMLNDFEEARIYKTNIHVGDSDQDGILDGIEVHVYHSNPLNKDSDGDGLDDLWEINNDHNPIKKDNWDKYFSFYILIPSVAIIFTIIVIFGSVDTQQLKLFSFRSIYTSNFQKHKDTELLYELLSFIPDNHQINVQELADKTGETVAEIQRILRNIVEPSNGNGYEDDFSKIIIRSTSKLASDDCTCFYCGGKVDFQTNRCLSCNELIVRCKLCKKPIEFDDSYASCSDCGVVAEKDEIIGFMTMELMCDKCLMNTRYHYI